MKSIELIDTGRVSYMESYELQLKLLEELNQEPEKAGYFIITEPDPTITKGIRGEDSEIFLPQAELERKGIEVVDIKRGGKVTFHGPGQVVIYPILNLNHFKKSIKWYIESLEEVVISTLTKLGVKVHKNDGIVGIFSDKGKVCAIGIEVKRWKTMHGIAINHEIDLGYFKSINPCGIGEMGVTSVANEGRDITRELIVEEFKKTFSKKFCVDII